MNSIENLRYSKEYNWAHSDKNICEISHAHRTIFTPLLYTCICFWKYGYWKISVRKTKFSSRPVKRVKSGISRFVRHKDHYNALEIHVFALNAKWAKEQCRQLLETSVFLSYVSHSKPLLLSNLVEVIQTPVEVY